MRKLVVLGGVGAAVAIGVTLWQGRDPVSTEPSTSAARIEVPVAPSAVVPPRAAAPSPADVDDAPAPAQVAAEPLTAEIDDGDNHGHADHAQDEIRPLEQPPLSRNAFGADPASETAALAEVRATLEALLDDPDPAVKEQASALLETIAAP
jgi:hypothetical protein